MHGAHDGLGVLTVPGADVAADLSVVRGVPVERAAHSPVATARVVPLRVEALALQRELANGEKFLKEEAKKLKVDMAKLAKDVKSEEVQKRIDADMAEAAKLGFQGTPGFLLNGIPVKGAYPTQHFDDLISELKKRGKITL